MSRAAINQLRRLVALSEVGRFDLPSELLEAVALYDRTMTLEIQPPARFDTDTAAAQVVTALANGAEVDLLALGHKAKQAGADLAAADAAHEILRQAREQAATSAQLLAADSAETVIRTSLRPAFEETLEEARGAAQLLAGQPRDAQTLLSASAKVRSAFLTIAQLATRHNAIRQARALVNGVGHREPRHDVAGFFSDFRDPMVFAPAWQPPMQLPRLPVPEDPTEALIWTVSDEAAPAAAWLPCVHEQDERWQEQFGAQQQNRADAAKFVHGFAAA